MKFFMLYAWLIVCLTSCISTEKQQNNLMLKLLEMPSLEASAFLAYPFNKDSLYANGIELVCSEVDTAVLDIDGMITSKWKTCYVVKNNVKIAVFVKRDREEISYRTPRVHEQLYFFETSSAEFPLEYAVQIGGGIATLETLLNIKLEEGNNCFNFGLYERDYYKLEVKVVNNQLSKLTISLNNLSAEYEPLSHASNF